MTACRQRAPETGDLLPLCDLAISSYKESIGGADELAPLNALAPRQWSCLHAACLRPIGTAITYPYQDGRP